jgi:very-short-patch-repair endonuclease
MRVFAKTMRREATDAERVLWDALRGRRFAAYKFRRQVPIGRDIADFACLSHKVIIEADGGGHEVGRDRVRDDALARHGFRVVRVTNEQILSGLGLFLSDLEGRLVLRNPDTFKEPQP